MLLPQRLRDPGLSCGIKSARREECDAGLGMTGLPLMTPHVEIASMGVLMRLSAKALPMSPITPESPPPVMTIAPRFTTALHSFSVNCACQHERI